MTDGSISNAINTLGHFHNGNFVSDTFSFGNVSLVYGYNCYAGYVYDGGNRWFPCIKTPTGSIIDRDRYGGYLYVGTGSQPQQHHVSSHELFYVPPFSNLFSAENAKFVEGLNYTRAVGLYRSEICGRFVLSGNLLQYYDVENDVVLGYSFDMEPVQGYLHKIGFGSENHGATNFVSVRFGEHYSLLYKNMLLQEWTNNSASFCCFGSWYMDAGDKILRNAESGESIDLSGVLSETITGNVGSGIHGEMATYVSDSEHEEKPLMYIVSANSVFRLPWVGGHVTGNNLIYWPLPCHLRKIYFFYEQVVYVINKDGFTAYDMQTFLRLDDLPGFQSAVEKVWERA